MLNRAYSILTVKAVEEAEQRIITGVATSPQPDRMGDIVEPLGVRFKNPLPLLHQHNSLEPVGTVTFDRPTKNGITFTARFATVTGPQSLKERIDLAWAEVKSGLVRAVSIGFRAVEKKFIGDGAGIRFTETEVLELSLVTVPANEKATITTIRSIDTAQRAASGRNASDVKLTSPGVSGFPLKRPEGIKMKTIAEQITTLEHKRAASSSRAEAVMQQSLDEERTSNTDEQEEFDRLDAEIKAVDGDLVRLRAIEKSQAHSAKPVTQGTALDVRSSISVKGPVKLPPGIAFARLAMAKAISFKEMMPAWEVAKQMWPDHDELHTVLKAAVVPGSSSTLAPLMQPTWMATEMIEYLWHRTIVGRVQGLRRVPFNIKVPRQTSVASVSWVGEAAPKPLSAFALDTVTLGYYKIAGIVALTDEIVKLSNPSAEAMVRDELANAIVTLMDHDFIDPEKAAVANISPASITNGVTPVTATGTAYSNFAADFGAVMAKFDAARIDTSSLAVVMSSRIARSLSLMLNSLGQPLFPSISATGGTAMGYQVIVSGNVDPTGDVAANGDNIIFFKPDEVFLADDGGVSIDISREASVQMDSAPDNPALATTILISAFQHNLALIRAERYCNWLKRRAEAAQFISGAKYA